MREYAHKYERSTLLHLKMSGLRVQTFCIEKDSNMDAIKRVNTFKCYFSYRNKDNKILLGPPPPHQKRRRDTKGRDVATRTCVCLYQQPVTWILTRSILID